MAEEEVEFDINHQVFAEIARMRSSCRFKVYCHIPFCYRQDILKRLAVLSLLIASLEDSAGVSQMQVSPLM